VTGVQRSHGRNKTNLPLLAACGGYVVPNFADRPNGHDIHF
jgi:hypothetical protein